MTYRRRNTNRYGQAFTELLKAAVWQKGLKIPGYSPTLYRRDVCGALMKWSDYGKITRTGWEIDHIRPAAHGGSDELHNLQPLQWENNRSKGDTLLGGYCKVKS